MTLIKCPKCGQTVLSVATTCPKCQYLLTQNSLQQGGQSELITCRRCQKMIAAGSVTCEYCGYPVRLRRRIRRIAWSVVAVAVVAVGAVVAVQIQGEYRPGGGAERSMEPTLPLLPPAAPVTARPETTGAPAETGRDTTLTTPATAIPDTLRPPPNAVLQYVAVWGNVRTARDTLSPALRRLAPGTAVLTARPLSGWYAIYVDSIFAGYMAGDLLERQPPASSPPPDTSR